MSTTPTPQTTPLTLAERLELANRLFREYHTSCFWHSPRDLVITEELLPLVANGLRKHGGRRGFVLAAQLLPNETAERPEQCRDDGLRLDWAADSPFRFFPVEPDKEFGYCLHPADLAVNKVLALAGRREIRDLLDILYLDGSYLSLGAIVWAACGKDPGYTPSLILDLANRHVCYQDSDLLAELLARPIVARDLKTQWLTAKERAQNLFPRLPAKDLGCLYVDGDNKPVTPDPDNVNFSSLKRHRGSVRGAWPTIS
jgi:hypothetical protein